MKYRFFILGMFFIVLFSWVLFISTPKNSYCFTSEEATVLKTDGFNLDTEILKAISNPESRADGTNMFDRNNDGILTMEEMNCGYTVTLDCSNCAITDWSCLSYFGNIQQLYIKNIDGELVKFENIKEDNQIRDILMSNATNIENLFDGISNFNNLTSLSISTKETFSGEYLKNLENLTTLSLDVQGIVDLESVFEIRDLSSLSIHNTILSDNDYRIILQWMIEHDKIESVVGYNPRYRIGYFGNNIIDMRKLKLHIDNSEIADYSIEATNDTADYEIIPKKAGETLLTITYDDISLTYDINIIEMDTPEPTPAVTAPPTPTSVVTATPSPTPIETIISTASNNPNEFTLGDVDKDEDVDATDALLVLKHAAKVTDLSGTNLLAADTSKDEKVDASDALLILKYAAKIIDSFK